MTVICTDNPTWMDEDLWLAVCARDASYDGNFLYGVITTGVYCRPSCPSRAPLRENVRFFSSAAEAEKAGLRACKRCRPDSDGADTRSAGLVAKACRMIDEAEDQPSLDALAAHVGLSPFHFHRLFKKTTGLTPKGYAKARREERMRERLAGAQSVTEAIFEAGYNSSARFYEHAENVLGMAPSSRRKNGAGEEIHFAIGECSLGSILVAATHRGVCAISIGDDPDALVEAFQDEFKNAKLIGADEGFEALVANVVGLVEAPANGFNLPLDVRGTSFQQRVWQALRRIPAGTTATYADVADAVGAPNAVRSVAQACGANRLAVAIPCHRVVRKDGSHSGYRWGVDRKRALLEREAAA